MKGYSRAYSSTWQETGKLGFQWLLEWFLLALLAGCGNLGKITMNPPETSSDLSAHNTHGPKASLIHMPNVSILANQQASGWLTPEVLKDNPFWTAYLPVPGTPYESSAETLARLPAILDKNPDVLVIMAGIFDLTNDPTWDYPANCPTTCTNITSMIVQAHQAGAKVIWCLGPLIQYGSAGTPLITNPARLLPLDIEEWYFYRIPANYIQAPLPEGADGVVLLFQAVGQTADGRGQKVDTAAALDWTDDGVSPNANGASLFTNAVLPAIQNLEVGGSK